MDYSTINLERLKLCRKYTLPPTYHLQRDPGNGCAGDPPGFPSYFTRSVWTQHGSYPHRGPQLVIAYEGVLYVVDEIKLSGEKYSRHQGWYRTYERKTKPLRWLYKPLPLSHPRVQAWLSRTKGYHGGGHTDPGGDGGRFNGTVYKNDSIIGASDEDVVEMAEALGFPEHWLGDGVLADVRRELVFRQLTPSWVSVVRQWYPDFDPDEWEVEAGYGKGGPGNWWETEAEQPTPEECKPRWGRHPMNGSWCQWCGWVEEEMST